MFYFGCAKNILYLCTRNQETNNNKKNYDYKECTP
nr:MAG TPA: hypothetical protein [Caudoviricetes sp.]